MLQNFYMRCTICIRSIKLEDFKLFLYAIDLSHNKVYYFISSNFLS